MSPEEQAKAEAAAQEAAEKAAAAEAAKQAAEEKKAQEAAEKAAAAEAKKATKKKTIDDLKSTDDVVITFKNPVFVEEDGEDEIKKEPIKQFVKYAFWLGLKKDAKGNPSYDTLKGAKLFGYVENGKVIEF